MSPQLGVKRKQSESSSGIDGLTSNERVVFSKIQSMKDLGINARELKRYADPTITKSLTKLLRSLVEKHMIKGIKSVHSKGYTHYFAAEFKPSTEITGGVWYTDGNLDRDYIEGVKIACRNIIAKLKVTTLEGIVDSIKRMNISTVELSKQDVEQIVNDLVLENEVVREKSTGTGELASIPVGRECYKSSRKVDRGVGAMASVPCGACPQISICDPDGIVSPKTCVYYKAWLDF